MSNPNDADMTMLWWETHCGIDYGILAQSDLHDSCLVDMTIHDSMDLEQAATRKEQLTKKRALQANTHCETNCLMFAKHEKQNGGQQEESKCPLIVKRRDVSLAFQQLILVGLCVHTGDLPSKWEALNDTQ